MEAHWKKAAREASEKKGLLEKFPFLGRKYEEEVVANGKKELLFLTN